MNPRLVDEVAFVEALSDFARATVERNMAEALLLRLARRLVTDAALTDAQVVRLAGREALAALARAKERAT